MLLWNVLDISSGQGHVLKSQGQNEMTRHFGYMFCLATSLQHSLTFRMQLLGVHGRWHRYPISSRIRRMISPLLTLTKRAMISASAVEGTINYRRDVRTWIGQLNFIGCLSWESHPRKKCPAAWLLALGVARYEASEWMLSIISDFYLLGFCVWFMYGCIVQ